MTQQQDQGRTPDKGDEFLRAAQEKERGLVAEFIAFMAENKVWWLTPILIVFGLLGVLLILGATGVAPFIYALM
ncbi:MAG: hypothetical protein JNK49_08150 [Planctomycetes bacterium]|nr:hypothetical protein [Planctomycetota bacterium]